MAQRDSIRVVKGFLNWLQDDVLKSTFPIKYKSTLVTLCTLKFVRDYNHANNNEKDEMMKEMQRLQKQAEEDGILENSREIDNSE